MAGATLTSKGQITLPKEIRDHLRLRGGDRLEFVVRGHGVVELVSRSIDVFSLFGLFKSKVRRATLEDMEEGIRKGATGELD